MRAQSVRLVTYVALLGGLLASGRVGAKEQFPGDVARHLGLGYTPPCRLCHIQGTTGSGSVATPFGISMLAHGLSGDNSSLTAALDGLRADKTDSDGDGTSDIDELLAGTDPNTPVNAPLVDADPKYGCSVAGVNAATPAAVGTGLGALAALGVLVCRERRRRSATNRRSRS